MRTGSRLRKAGIWILIATVAMTLGTASALAWGKKDTNKKVPPKAINKHQYPDMVFQRGVLNRDIYGGWEIGDQTLIFNENTRVTKTEDSFSTPVLSEGQEAVVTGYIRGGMLVVHRLTMIEPDESVERGSFNVTTKSADLPELKAGTPQ